MFMQNIQDTVIRYARFCGCLMDLQSLIAHHQCFDGMATITIAWGSFFSDVLPCLILATHLVTVAYDGALSP